MPSTFPTHNVAPRVLIIENDALIAEMIHDMVRDLGYTVTRTGDLANVCFWHLRTIRPHPRLSAIGVTADRQESRRWSSSYS